MLVNYDCKNSQYWLATGNAGVRDQHTYGNVTLAVPIDNLSEKHYRRKSVNAKGLCYLKKTISKCCS